MSKIIHLSQEIDWLLDWLDTQFDAGKSYEEIKATSYYARLVEAMREVRAATWGRCADCANMTQTCIVELLATGRPVEVCPEILQKGEG